MAKAKNPQSSLSSRKDHAPRSVEDITHRNVRAILRLEEAAKANRSQSDFIADLIARFCGSMKFVWVHVIWFSGWIVANSIPTIRHFDPFPFTFLTLVVSLEAIFLSTFILISQNQEAVLTDRRNQLDLQINLLTEQENTEILRILERIAEKVGARIEDPDMEALDQPTHPEKLAEQIERASKPNLASKPNQKKPGSPAKS